MYLEVLHGFSVLSADSVLMIKIDRYFASGESIGIKYDDEDFVKYFKYEYQVNGNLSNWIDDNLKEIKERLLT